jgi:hypothetical protein
LPANGFPASSRRNGLPLRWSESRSPMTALCHAALGAATWRRNGFTPAVELRGKVVLC